uniref:Uncharacterized protein n=1 Tax=Leersia perrieri TaxID=77586 RepID=A0A0D9UXC2_9ORYZ
MHHLRRSPRLRELNEKAEVNNNEVSATKPIVLQDSTTRKEKEKVPIVQSREANLQRTPFPHQLNLQSSRQINIDGSAYMSHLLGMNETQTSHQVHDRFGFSSASFGQSSSQPQNQVKYAGIVPREGQTTAYLYYPLLSSFTPNASTPSASASASKQGAPMVHDNTTEQLKKLVEENNFGGSNSNPRSAIHQQNHHISSFYPVHPLPLTNPPLQRPARNGHPPLPPSYPRSELTTGNGNTRSASVLGKRPAEENYFHPPPPPPAAAAINADDEMAAVERGPQCRLQTVDLLSLIDSVGTPEFMANSARVLRSDDAAGGGSLYEQPRRDAVPAAEPSLVLGLGLGDGNGNERDEVWSFWNSSAMARTMERKRGTEGEDAMRRRP